MKALVLALKQHPLVYVTLDIERALGLPLTTHNYYIVTNSDPFSRELAKKHKNIILVKDQKLLSTRELLENEKTAKLIKRLPNPHILVFKNTTSIESICQKNNWKLLNPPSTLANSIEEKISQITWLGSLAKFLPPHQVQTCSKLEWKNKKFILQFNFAHTGNGTFLINSAESLQKIKNQFPERPVRVLTYIEGPTFTNNNVVWGKKVLSGAINYQITGLSPFTNRPFATIGNDWQIPNKILTKEQKQDYYALATMVGEKLAESGWKGLFGIDVVVEQKTGKIYLIEVNARQPASTTCESLLQKENGTKNKMDITTFEAHLAALLGLENKNEKNIQLKQGAQIVKRVNDNETELTYKQKLLLQKKLPTKLFKTILYTNNEIGSESIRIQCKNGLLKKHNELNEFGEKIKNLYYDFIKPASLKKVGLNFRWDSKKIWALKLPITKMDITKLIWHFNLPFWDKEGTDEWNLTPWELIKNPEKEPAHLEKIHRADLKHPIDITKQKGRYIILDGLHRLVKAFMRGDKNISVRIIPRTKISLIKIND
jgi:predicted ATP-grasp superfamily ATP-dependent carboligase